MAVPKKKKPRKRPTRRRQAATGTRKRAPLKVRRTMAEQLARRLAERASETADTFRPRPSHWRYLKGKIECLNAGQPPTTVNLAKQCAISRVALWKLQRRWPWLDRWCDEVLRDANAHYWGAIERRMALTALQGGGSPAHAEVYCKMRLGGFGPRPGFGEGGDAPAPGVVQPIINLLIPRPDYPVLPGAPPPVVAARPATIPTVGVTRG